MHFDCELERSAVEPSLPLIEPGQQHGTVEERPDAVIDLLEHYDFAVEGVAEEQSLMVLPANLALRVIQRRAVYSTRCAKTQTWTVLAQKLTKGLLLRPAEWHLDVVNHHQGRQRLQRTINRAVIYRVISHA